MKILSKIKRRTNGDELPHRGEYVEMDLFDTDRRPLEFPAAVASAARIETLGATDFGTLTSGNAGDVITSKSITLEGSSLILGWAAVKFTSTGYTGPASWIETVLNLVGPLDTDPTNSALQVQAQAYCGANGTFQSDRYGGGDWNPTTIGPGDYTLQAILNGDPDMADIVINRWVVGLAIFEGAV